MANCKILGALSREAVGVSGTTSRRGSQKEAAFLAGQVTSTVAFLLTLFLQTSLRYSLFSFCPRHRLPESPQHLGITYLGNHETVNSR